LKDQDTAAADVAAYRVELRPIAALKPTPGNARTHSADQVAQLRGLIAEFGWTNPILADADGIVAGHGRHAAATEIYSAGGSIRTPAGAVLPDGHVPVIDCTGWSEAQRKAYILADNQSALNAGWDFELLRIELADLTSMGFDLSMTAFGADELKTIMGAADVTEMPDLADGDREPFQKMTFALHDDQAEQVKAAIEVAKAMGPFTDSPNDNSNGNALARIVETFLTGHGQHGVG
jgi:hypothetical protein